VIEFTKDKTLWFNFNLFQGELDLIGKDCVEERDLIKDWFESRFLNKPKVWATFNHAIDSNQAVEDTIQNGVKHTQGDQQPFHIDVEDTIENGVRDISPMTQYADWQVEEIIQNGVKETLSTAGKPLRVEDTIQNGVKETISTLRRTAKWGVDDIIQNGVKEIRSNKGLITSYRQNHKAKKTIENGVKDTKPMDEWVNAESIIENTIEYGVKETCEDVYHHKGRIGGVIKNGVKEVQPLPAQDGNRDWGNYYFGKQDRTKPFNDYLNDAIKYGKKI
jgi:hypothetical protein